MRDPNDDYLPPAELEDHNRRARQQHRDKYCKDEFPYEMLVVGMFGVLPLLGGYLFNTESAMGEGAIFLILYGAHKAYRAWDER